VAYEKAVFVFHMNQTLKDSKFCGTIFQNKAIDKSGFIKVIK